MLDFLNQNSGALMVIFTAVVTVSTAVYAILTAYLVAETRRMRRAQTDAKIEIVLKPSEEWVQLVNLYIRNIGLGPAYDLSFDINPETMTEGTRQLIEDFTMANFLKSGLKYLGPGQEVVSHDSQMNENFEQKMSSVLHFIVHYKSATGKQHQERFRVDVSELKGFSRIGTPPLYVIARSLIKIESTIHNAFSGSSRIKADVFTEEDRRREKKEWEEYRDQAIGQKNVKPPDS